MYRTVLMLQKHWRKFQNDRTVYVYCYSGQTASQTVFLLHLAGKQAINVSGGLTKVFPVRKLQKS
mgnify:CR=1 FL=1